MIEELDGDCRVLEDEVLAEVRWVTEFVRTIVLVMLKVE